MNRGRIIAPALASALVVLGACGDQAADSTGSESTSSGRAAANTERITTGGVAVLVQQHFGREAVREFRRAGSEPGAVGVMVQLTEGGRDDNFGVQAYSPQGSDFPGRQTCAEAERQRGQEPDFSCVELEDGRTVYAYLSPEGFSDDNTDGMTLLAASTSDAGAVIAMYESYDRTPPLDTEDLVDLLSEPRLAWMTDPAVNRAGAEIEVLDFRA